MDNENEISGTKQIKMHIIVTYMNFKIREKGLMENIKEQNGNNYNV